MQNIFNQSDSIQLIQIKRKDLFPVDTSAKMLSVKEKNLSFGTKFTTQNMRFKD